MFFLKKIFRNKLNIEEVEDLLYESGVEPKFAEVIITKVKDKGSNEDNLRNLIKSELIDQFKEKEFGNFIPLAKSLILVAGNNGSGKTTFIGKFIQYFQQNNIKPAVIAADTFRAAAIEQLEYFANRFSIPIVKGSDKEDPSAVVYRGIDQLSENDVIIVDTSGRQHNNKNLMGELQKINNIINKKSESFVDIKNLLTIDANTGLASKHIIKGFQEYLPLDGIIINKVDANAKYGALLSILNDFNIPIIFEGYGENISDLRKFHFEEYLDRLI